MNFERLFYDSSRALSDQVTKLIGNDPQKFQQLYEFVISGYSKASERAARSLDVCCEQYAELIYPYLDELVHHSASIKSVTKKRCMMRILTRHPIPENENTLGFLMNHCFGYLEDPKESIAVKVYSMEILYEMSKVIPEIRNELRHLTEENMRYGSAGIRSFGSKILRKL